MNLILFGPPGAGKGTQSTLICEKFNLKQISTGDLLRLEINKGSVLGKEIENIINNGNFVSDLIVLELLEKVISSKDYTNNFILDGYPRNLNQIKNLNDILNKNNQYISGIIFLNVHKEIIKKRIDGRVFCTKCKKMFNTYFNPPNKNNHTCKDEFLQKRSDDNLKTILHRYDTYMDQTEPVLDYYKKDSSFYEIDGNQEISDIFVEINSILSNLSNWH